MPMIISDVEDIPRHSRPIYFTAGYLVVPVFQLLYVWRCCLALYFAPGSFKEEVYCGEFIFLCGLVPTAAILGLFFITTWTLLVEVDPTYSIRSCDTRYIVIYSHGGIGIRFDYFLIASTYPETRLLAQRVFLSNSNHSWPVRFCKPCSLSFTNIS
jgi:hypothetical protein